MRSILAFIILATLVACTSLASTQRASVGSVVSVMTDSGHGTGFPVSKHCVVTAEHVVDGAEKTVRIAGADKVEHQAKVVRQDAQLDIAVVCAEKASMKPVRFAQRMPDQFAPVYTIGDPLVYNRIMTEGRYQGGSTITADVAPGNSGGPVFDENGDVIGFADALAVMMSPMGVMTFAHLATIVTIDKIQPFVAGTPEAQA
ncbi:S1 family peptidase [Burkholderia sp. JKS000303]|uniref:S1 family peptidase n=1 Tax=Burkholderia sp. JKS000303 TaxID=1938747 RepID=UPI000BF9A6EE|nr:serine protease [Burkholderia sp. JKS000303]PFH12857.1 trypsin-like peptidase [Burkholderia sp. JKS000303]